MLAFERTLPNTPGLESAFGQAMREIGVSAEIIHASDSEIRSLPRNSLRSLYGSWGKPSAILCASHREAVFVLCMALELAIQIPEQLSIISCDDCAFLDRKSVV